MPENILYNLIYSLFSGVAELFCVDAAPHQRLFELLGGQKQADPWLTLWLRVGVLAALICSNWSRIRRLMRERRLSLRVRRHRQSDPLAQLDLRFFKTTVIPALAGVLLYARAGELITTTASLALSLTVNGVILFIPRVVSRGNKDGRSVSRLDGVLMGLGSVLGAVPGISRMSGMLTAAAIRGIDRSYALDMALLLSIPVLAGLLVFDIVAVVTAGAALGLLSLVFYVVYAALAFGGAWLMQILMRYMSVKIGYSGFAYYSWGFALFAFILYLII